MKLFGMCIDKRVVIGVVAGAGLLWWLAPADFSAALPLLIFAICPLSMLLMMKAMNGNQANGQPGGSASAAQPPVGASPEPHTASTSAVAADVDARRN